MGVQRAKKTQGGFGWERGRPGFAWHRRSAESRRLETIPGVGYITATAIAATVTDPAQFRSGREFAAWLGLTPRQNSSGGKERLGRISKMGDGYLRTLLVVGATAVMRYARQKTAAGTNWVNGLLATKPARVKHDRRRVVDGH
jgi:transposase